MSETSPSGKPAASSKANPLVAVGKTALILDVIGWLVKVLRDLTELYKLLPPQVRETIDRIPLWAQWVGLIALGLLGLAAWVQGRRKVSRLLRPERFNLDPDNPRHLKGRGNDLKNLIAALGASSLVELTGESGSGKTALLRSGLLPALNAEKGMYPVYVDSYGRDWKTGPLETLAFALQHTLTDEERKKLGFEDITTHDIEHGALAPDPAVSSSNPGTRPYQGPVTPKLVLPLLASFSEKLHRVPLIIFDQFDDYQAAHRRKFRGRNGQWMRSNTLTKKNWFWKQIANLLNGRRLRLLFASRADMASGLHSVRFVQSENLPLDRVEAKYLSPLLNELTSADGGPDVVEEPTAGWDQLKDRLARDLERDKLALPIQVLISVRGLAYLPKRRLTIRNYEHVGGTRGLEALYVEQSIAKSTQSLKSHGTKIDAPGIRRLLLAMVDEGAKEEEGSVPKPLSKLAGLSNLSLEVTEKVLRDLERQGLVRPRHPDMGRAVAKEAWWSLYHDYLARGVRAAEERANRWVNLLKEGQLAYKNASEAGNKVAQWRSLLTPLQQLRLLWHRLRGKFRYGEQSGYARLSLVRFASWLVACVGTLLAVYAVLRWGNANHAAELVQRLLDAETQSVPQIIDKMQNFRPWTDQLLRNAYTEEEQAGSKSATEAERADHARRQLHASLALLPVDAGQVDYLYGRLLDAEPQTVLVIRDLLSRYIEEFVDKEKLVEKLWAVVQQPTIGRNLRRLRAASALAKYDPGSERWARIQTQVANDLVAVNAVFLPTWMDLLRDVKGQLQGPLISVFRDNKRQEAERFVAASILGEYAADQLQVLADLLMDADAKQLEVFFPRLRAQAQEAAAKLQAELERKPQSPSWPDQVPVPSWQSVSAHIVGQLKSAKGLCTERFALCQTLSLDDFAALAEAMRSCCYRPVRVRPYIAEGKVLVAAVWHRDGRNWCLVQNVSAAEIEKHNTELKKQNYLPIDVAGWFNSAETRYLTIWVEGQKKDESDLCVGVTWSQHEAALRRFQKAGLQPATIQIIQGPDGQARCSAVFRKASAIALVFANDDQGTCREHGLGDGLPVDVNLMVGPNYVCAGLGGWLTGSPWLGLAWSSRISLDAHLERLYAGVYSIDTAFDHEQIHGVTLEEQLACGQKLADHDYRPVALSVACGWPQPALIGASIWHRPAILEKDKERLAKRQAAAGVALMRLGQGGAACKLFQFHPDPRARSYLLASLRTLGADPEQLVQKQLLQELKKAADPSVRRALLVGLGEFSQEQFSVADRAALLPRLSDLYQNDPDKGVHGAADWLLRQWHLEAKLAELDAPLKTGKIEDDKLDGSNKTGKLKKPREWYLDTLGQTYVVIPQSPTPFLMGSPRGEAGREDGPKGILERQHRRHISRTFALGAKEVTVADFQRFVEAQRRKGRDLTVPYNETYSPTDVHPMNKVSWYQAAEYCNWLSAQEQLDPKDWCYEPEPTKGFAHGMRMKPDYLKLKGYRLPTEAEWEYACRAGTLTARYYGDTDDLLGRYAWYTANTTNLGMQPVGQTRPNDWGLFDMLGNALEWCQDSRSFYPRPASGNPVEDMEELGPIKEDSSRVLRGGSFFYKSGDVRSAYRNSSTLSYGVVPPVGFRVARTVSAN